MKIIETDIAPIFADQEGDCYFFVGETIYYLNEFIKTSGDKLFDGVTSLTNNGGMGIKIDEAEEIVDYTIFTI